MPNVSDPRVAAFLSALDQVAGLVVVESKEEVLFEIQAKRLWLDFLVQVRFKGETSSTSLAIESTDNAYPRDAEKLRDRFCAREMQGSSAKEVPVVVASSLSSNAQKVLRDGGINFYETSSGTLYYRHGLRLIDIQRESKEPSDQRKIRSVFNGAREQVIHALFVHWLREGRDAWVSGAELAELAGTSPFTVSTTMQELERNSWIDVTGSGPTLRRKLSRPEQLLDAWAQAWKQRVSKEKRTRWYGYASGPGGIVDCMLERLADAQSWMMTGAAAANAMSPHLTTVDRVALIVPQGHVTGSWASSLGLEPAEKGANVTFIERSGASLMFGDTHPERPGSRFASPFVVYLDLLDGVGRNKELAAEFRSRVLGLEEMDNG